MNKLIVQLCIILLMVFTLPSYTNAYDEVLTHKDITEVAASEKSNLKNYLINNLGISKGLDTKINGKKSLIGLEIVPKMKIYPGAGHPIIFTIQPWSRGSKPA